MDVCRNCLEEFEPTEVSDREFCSWECKDEFEAHEDEVQEFHLEWKCQGPSRYSSQYNAQLALYAQALRD